MWVDDIVIGHFSWNCLHFNQQNCLSGKFTLLIEEDHFYYLAFLLLHASQTLMRSTVYYEPRTSLLA